MNRFCALPLCLCVALCAGPALARGNFKRPLQQATRAEAERSNPYEGQPPAARAGQKLYQRECAGCHGSAAQGARRGPALASPALAQAPPGAIFQVLRHGSLRAGMPSFSHLPEAQRWQIVAYLKSLR